MKHFYGPYKRKQLERLEIVEECDGNVEVRQVEGSGGTTIPATFDGETSELLFKETSPGSKGHADNRARRYMGKKFVKHYWILARTVKGLPVSDPWIVRPEGGGHEKRELSPEDALFMLSKIHERDKAG